MRHSTYLAAVATLFLTGCGAAEFSSDSTANGKSVNDAGATVAQGADATGTVRQPAVEDFTEMMENEPNEAAEVESENECCLQHGQGHGISVCVPGDKTEIAKLSPVAIRGNEVCIPAELLVANKDLFAAGKIGECQ